MRCFRTPALALVLLVGRHHQACQYPSVVGAVIAVVEQADVPAAGQGGEKILQRTGTLWRFQGQAQPRQAKTKQC